MASAGRLAVDGGSGESEALARSAEVFDEAGREIKTLVTRLNRLAEAVALRESAPGPRPAITGVAVRAIIAARGLRTEYFGAAIGEAAWAILLEAFAARLEGRRIATTDLGVASGLPKTTAHVWIHRLLDRGLLVRLDDPKDVRIALIDLSDEGADRMHAYLAAVLRLSPWVA